MKKVLLIMLGVMMLGGCGTRLSGQDFQKENVPNDYPVRAFELVKGLCNNSYPNENLDCCIQRIMLDEGYEFIDPSEKLDCGE